METNHERLRLAILDRKKETVEHILGNIHPSYFRIYHEQVCWDMKYIFDYWTGDIPEFILKYLKTISQNTWKQVFLNLASNLYITDNGGYQSPCGAYGLEHFDRAFQAYKLADSSVDIFTDTEYLEKVLETAKNKNTQLWRSLSKGGNIYNYYKVGGR